MQNTISGQSILFADFYEFTMAQLYYRRQLHDKTVQFEYFFRDYPDYGKHKAGYCINAGLEWLVEWIKNVRCTPADIDFLRRQRSRGGSALFSEDFLEWFSREGHFGGITIRAIGEGRVVHPNVPLVVVQGPFAMAQLLETALLNHLNYQILVATKASRIRNAGCNRTMIEFGMRRAQGLAAHAGARAALIGGADFTSNTQLSSFLGITPKGTHAHSMVQVFMALGQGELAAFRAYAEIYPDDCLLLVDTINTLESGVPNAITVFTELKRKGHAPVGIRLDSGDLAYLSIQAAKMLDAAGFPDTVIVLSNQLDELILWQIISQIRSEAPRYGVDVEALIKRLVYGVGTGLITSRGDAALDGVYKLTAVYEKGCWIPAIKVSESAAKTINPGYKSVWRIYDTRNEAIADVVGLSDEDLNSQDTIRLYHPTESRMHRELARKDISCIEPLHADILKEGKQVYSFYPLQDARAYRDADLSRLDEGVKRLLNPHVYHVSLTEKLWELKQGAVRVQG